MRWVYVGVILVIFYYLVQMPVVPPLSSPDNAVLMAREAQIPNTVTGVLLRNRLYDTLFEILVFTLAVLGVQYGFAQHDTEDDVVHLNDPTMVILTRIGAMVSALIFLELSLRGHLAPGGGFAAGVAGGTAVGLVTLTSDPHQLHDSHVSWHIGTVEKALVLLLLLIAGVSLLAPDLETAGRPFSSLVIPPLNVLIAAKVAIGSWTIVLLFIRHRGLL